MVEGSDGAAGLNPNSFGLSHVSDSARRHGRPYVDAVYARVRPGELVIFRRPSRNQSVGVEPDESDDAGGDRYTPVLKSQLVRDVLVVTAVKLAVVIAAALLVFSPAQRPRVDAEAIEARIIDEPIVSSTPRDTSP